MILGTTYVKNDEPALNLAEVNLIAPQNNGTSDTDWYRFQIIVVMRDGDVYEYRERLGLAEDFKAHQFRIMGGSMEEDGPFVDETVGSLKDEANRMRDEKPFDIRLLIDMDKKRELLSKG
ncbi:hypothetical protein LCGC14_2823660 [marine sediment metagenome]|uniref:Uncharacterized protein n=1 Tax=marine sediment metagenome TaxID=412755 RepID=A0A0F9B7F0_9ZZZZ